MLVGVDEQTALVRTADGPWEVHRRGQRDRLPQGREAEDDEERHARSTSRPVVYVSLIVTVSIVGLDWSAPRRDADRQRFDLLGDIHARLHRAEGA